jgi:ribosomal protein S18 acetylase RimI-like enzyme
VMVVPNRPQLVQEQAADLMTKYGERVGSARQRLLKAGLIWIRPPPRDPQQNQPLESSSPPLREQQSPVGLVALAEVLMDRDDGSIMTPEASLEHVQAAVASLGPKQRRVFLKASAQEIVDDLLPESSIVCLVSNLSVAVAARRQGIGMQLCQAAEEVAHNVWGHDRLYLKVETTNEAALHLYQTKLQYGTEFAVSTDSGVRLDLTKGVYTIQDSIPTLLMSKQLL